MISTKIAAFSNDNKYFACFSTEDKLLIWETLSTVFIDCKFDSNVYSTCTSIHWVLPQHKYASPKKTKKLRNSPEGQLLAVGTAKGDILLYNIENKNLYLHLVARHSDAVNDMCFYSETNSLFTCSNDKFIAILDTSSGKQISKWKAGDSAVSSICVIDDNNILSSSTSILWWNISKKCIIKKFTEHSTEIFKLLPVNADSLNSCYFLSAAVSDFKINAWSLNSAECETPVASFVLPDQPADIDISKVSSKDKPLILSTITKNGFLHLFEHTLNGNLNQPIQPKASVEISLEIPNASIITTTKLSPDSESCIIAYSTSKCNILFKHIKIRDYFKQNKDQYITPDGSKSQDMSPVVKETNKIAKSLLINGVKSASTSEKSPRKTRLKEVDTIVSSYRRKLRSSSTSSLIEPDILNTNETEDLISNHKSRSCKKKLAVKVQENSTDLLLEGLQTQNEDILNVVFRTNDTEFISTSVKNLPTNSLKEVLIALNHRLHHHEKYSPSLSKWLKEVLKVHMNYFVQSQDTVELLSCIKEQMNSMKISETISKISVLKGFLNLNTQNSSSEENDSENEEPMEL